jgi:hypothetical protein
LGRQQAAMRAKTVGDAVWPIIRSKHPATYLYLCARLRRSISEAEALELILICPNSIMNQSRGLAIWAVGQMGMVRVLDEVAGRGEELSSRTSRRSGAFQVNLSRPLQKPISGAAQRLEFG